MNYDNAIAYIEKISLFGSKPGLERIRILLERLGNPQDNLKFIHVAGTNGKGSTCAMLQSILINAGYNVGLYTSPHLEKYNERIKINNIDISDEEFANLTCKIKSECSEMLKDGQEHPTIFECITAMGLYYFYSNNLDYVILEVGLGGRYDATNIINSPILSIITAIGIDHMEYLGDTIEKIAIEKGGIIKNNFPTVLYFQSDCVYNIIKDICTNRNSKLYYFDYMETTIKYEDLYQTIFSIRTDYYEYNDITLNMIGEYQIYNSATVLLAIEALRDNGVKISNDNILKGLKETYWKGRMELISTNPYIILDGAHNIDGIEMLYRYIKKHFLNKNITLLIGVLKDKEYKKMVDILIPLVNNIVITEPTSTRALTTDTLEYIISIYNLPTYIEKEITNAFDIAKKITNPDEIIICAGSLYLIAELRNIIFKGE